MATTTRGAISSGIRPGQLVTRTLAFVRDQLHVWRDDPTRASSSEDAEEVLNAQLCKFLNVTARAAMPMVHFSHEERQAGQRRVDIAANPTSSMTIASQLHTIYTAFLVFEGKRLPTPLPRTREREYVHGHTDDVVSGGIQRFKRGLHGGDQEVAAMIGYLQDGDAAYWYGLINQWIDERASTATSPDESWSQDEWLQALKTDKKKRTAACRSSHARANSRSATVVLHHLWVEF